ncbi:MAG: 1,6-anhydro-N-acetylmuramyl-L-alanine amidase AmpD [Gammaproteobacteria bacterium]|nr:1,6-anhydro-N-acetylmuramyl-L-alanine amidase AmpD [Gammaproteobacteria bacterium]
MEIDINTKIIKGITYIPSPNHDERSDPEDIYLLVIHGISLPPNRFGGPYIEHLFTNCLNPSEHPFFKEIEHLRVSSHLLIRRGGEIVQFVPLNKRAWHAGVSSFKGREQCNDFSIGIELEGTDETPYESEQYESLIKVTGLIQSIYPKVTLENIAGHCDIAPGRKTDPGPFFDWSVYKNGLGIHGDKTHFE